ncbi:MAG: VWA domain-containing protein [Acidobacteria bacterium]|nr:VWA domain-containing protein [Acidobacteriota bacterium]
MAVSLRQAAHLVCILLVSIPEAGHAQAGRKSPSDGSGGLATLNVIVETASGGSTAKDPAARDFLSADKIELYDAGIEQRIEYFRPDYSPARLVILVDNSESVRAAADQRRAAINALVDQLYEGGQAMLVAYDRHPEVLEEFTADKARIRRAAEKLGKGGSPRLLDAIMASLNDALRLEVGISKRVIMLISDGYDDDSRTPFPTVLRNLQRDNVLVYAVRFEDRTRGASRRRALKPAEMLTQLTSGTGGRILDAKQMAEAARPLMKELSEQWYQLTYRPQGINPLIARRLLLTSDDRGAKLRTKSAQPSERL